MKPPEKPLTRRKLLEYIAMSFVSGISGASVDSISAVKLEQYLDQAEERNIDQYRKLIHELDIDQLLNHSEKILASKRIRKIHILKLNIILYKLEYLKYLGNLNSQISSNILKIKDFLQNSEIR